MKITLEGHENFDKFIKTFTRRIRKGVKKVVIQDGMDEVLQQDLNTLRVELFKIINQDIKAEENRPSGTLDEGSIDIPKSDEEILKHLTGLDIEKFRVSKDFSSLIDAGVVFAFDRKRGGYKIDNTLQGKNKSTKHTMSSGVNYRIDMSAVDTFESQYAKAVQFFNTAMYVFPDISGKLNYYINPGIDLTDCIKVVCSRDTGDTANSRSRFDNHWKGKGYADWSLKRECLDKIKNNFTNITDAIDAIKEADYDRATEILTGRSNRSTSISDFQEKVKDLQLRKDLQPSVQAYGEITTLIRNLRIAKKIKKHMTVYSLISSTPAYGPIELGAETFNNILKKTVGFWKITHKDKWFKHLVNKTEKLIQTIAKRF